jgi:hypothetical protein
MSQNDVVELELNIKEAEDLVSLGKSLERLEKNKDFKKVIQEQYLHNEAVRLVHLKSDGNMQDPRVQERLVRDIDAIGSFTQFLSKVFREADSAREAISICNEELDHINNEGEDA